jgi:hypothetical protein
MRIFDHVEEKYLFLPPRDVDVTTRSVLLGLKHDAPLA